MTSPAGALDHAEVDRMRRFIYIVLALAIIAAPSITLLPGGYVTTRLFVAGIGLEVLGLLYACAHARGDRRHFECAAEVPFDLVMEKLVARTIQRAHWA
jgi:hypothetical protein